MIKSKFESIFKQEMNENNVNIIMKNPLKKKFRDGVEEILNWKKFQPKPKDKLEDRALTCIYLKDYF